MPYPNPPNETHTFAGSVPVHDGYAFLWQVSHEGHDVGFQAEMLINSQWTGKLRARSREILLIMVIEAYGEPAPSPPGEIAQRELSALVPDTPFDP